MGEHTRTPVESTGAQVDSSPRTTRPGWHELNSAYMIQPLAYREEGGGECHRAQKQGKQNRTEEQPRTSLTDDEPGRQKRNNAGTDLATERQGQGEAIISERQSYDQ